MNTDEMLRVAQLIKQHPGNFNMTDWYLNAGDEDMVAGERWRVGASNIQQMIDHGVECETTGCIAGFAIASHPEAVTELLLTEQAIEPLAQDILGLTRIQRALLFYKDSWPRWYLNRADHMWSAIAELYPLPTDERNRLVHYAQVIEAKVAASLLTDLANETTSYIEPDWLDRWHEGEDEEED